jgi:hypothetical protein
MPGCPLTLPITDWAVVALGTPITWSGFPNVQARNVRKPPLVLLAAAQCNHGRGGVVLVPLSCQAFVGNDGSAATELAPLPSALAVGAHHVFANLSDRWHWHPIRAPPHSQGSHDTAARPSCQRHACTHQASCRRFLRGATYQRCGCRRPE